VNGTPLSSSPAACSVPSPIFQCANFQYQVSVPLGTNPATYAPSVILYSSIAPGYFFYDPASFLSLGIPNTLTVTAGPGPNPTCTLPPLGPGGGSGGQSDTTPPTLVGLCLSS
jgi:hypothetical protein